MGKVKRLSRNHPGKFAFDTTWLEWAHDPNYRWWERVSYLAYSRSRANGHASFRRGEIATTLGTSRQQVHKSIKAAIKYGLLGPGSHTECLLVPAHILTGGWNNGNENDACTTCGKGRKVPRTRAKKSPPTPTDSDSRTPSVCPSDTDRGSGGDRVRPICKVLNCGGIATARDMCDYCQKVELVVYERENDRDRADLFMELYVAQGDPRRSKGADAMIDREAN